MGFDSPITLASAFLDLRHVQQADVAPAVFNKTSLLERASHYRYAAAPNAKHMRKEFLREFQLIGAGQVAHAQQPAAQYPADLFPEGRDTQKGRSFITSDGRATLDIYAGPNEDGASPAQVVRRTVRAKRTRLTYERVAPNFFAIATRYKNRILYRRCNFDGRMIHCIDLAYPLSEKRAWDYNVTRISRSLRPL